MKRFIMALITVICVFTTGLSYAQGDGPPPIPEKVRNALERFIGTWTWEGGPWKGEAVCRWGPGEDFVVLVNTAIIGDQNISDTVLLGWDGVSKDGIASSRMMRASHQSSHLKIVSDTVISGETTGVLAGKTFTGKMRFVHQGPDQYTLFNTDGRRGDEAESDLTMVYKRVKGGDQAAAIRELTALDKAVWKAAIDADVATLDRIYAEDFIGLYYAADDDDDLLWTKERVLENFKSGANVISSYAYDEFQVHVKGHLAMITGLVTMQEKYQGQDISGQHRFTSTWAKRAGRWQCVGENYVQISSGAESASVAQEIRKLENQLTQAFLKNDVEALERLLADDLTYGTADGMSVAKDMIVEVISAGNYEATSIRYDIESVRVFGTAAIVTGTLDSEAQFMGEDVSGQVLTTNTWIKRKGQWQCIAIHGSRVEGM